MTGALLSVEGLGIAVMDGGRPAQPLVEDVSFAIAPGELFAIVGESGSGKTMIGRALMRLLPHRVEITAGTVTCAGIDVRAASPARLRALRGETMGMIFQEPMTSLNPSLTVGRQMIEGLCLHERLAPRAARARALEMLERVRIADPARAFASYPHQFSGGMRQRIMIASVLTMRPRLLIADEPTTALDALIRREIMELMIGLAREAGTAILLISHDLGLVAEHCARLMVLRHGRVVECGGAADILLAPRHPYTAGLIGALPMRGDGGAATDRAPLVEVEGLDVSFRRRGASLARAAARVPAVRGTTITVHAGETLAVVGESGSGKTTVARAILGLCTGEAGQIRFDGRPLDVGGGARDRAFRSRTAMIFQDPGSSLDPRMRLRDIVAEPLRTIEPDRATRRRRAEHALAEVGLPDRFAGHFPHQLSGGQRQRVAIARAIVGTPDLVVADEPVSALDPSIQHQVLALLAELRRRRGFACLFISHDLGVVEQVADRVAVMFHGRLLEIGTRDQLFDRPLHPYTIRLLEATPRIVPDAGGGFRLATSSHAARRPPAGMEWFNHGSIPSAPPSTGAAAMIEIEPGHWVACAPAGAESWSLAS